MRVALAGATLVGLLLIGNVTPATRPVNSAAPASQPETLDDLMAVLQSDQSPPRRAAAAEKIGKLGAEAQRAIPVLVAHVSQAPPPVRGAAIAALGEIGQPSHMVVEALIAALEDIDKVNLELPVWAAAAKVLASFGPDVVPRLIEELRGDSDQRLRGAAITLFYLGPHAAPAVDDLIKIVERDASETRLEAIQALEGVGPEARSAVTVLIQMLDSEDFHTQYAACRAIAGIGSAAREATPSLIGLLREGVTSVRRNAAIALGAIGPTIGPEAADALTAALDDPSQFVKADAAEAIGKLGDLGQRAVPTLENALRSKSIQSQARVARSHWKITGETEKAIDALVAELERFDEAWLAARVLGEIGPAASVAVEPLASLLESPHAPSRAHAARALGKIGPAARTALPALRRHTTDLDADVRHAVQQAIGRLAGDQ